MKARVGFALLALAGAFSLGAADYTVSGIVVDSRSNSPLNNARVLLAPTTGRLQKLEEITKQDGRFLFTLSQPGKYTLQIVKPGYPVQAYRAASFAGLSSAIVVREDQDTSHIVFPASRQGAVTGVIQDEDSEPVGNALVTIFQSLVSGGERKIVVRGQTRANSAGQFRVAYLPLGNYYVCAMGRPWFADSLLQMQEIQDSIARLPKSIAIPAQSPGQPEPVPAPPQYSPDPAFRGTAFQTTFYPRAQTIEEASLVRVDAGGEAQVAVTLPLTKAVSVKGAVAFSNGMSGGRANLLKKAYDQYVLFLDAMVANDGTFQFKNVPAGSYEIVAASNVVSGGFSWQVRELVEVGTSDVDLNLRPGFTGAFAGHVSFEGERPASAPNLFVTLRNEEGHAVGIPVDPEGNFLVNRIMPGRYEVATNSSDYVAEYFSGPSRERLPLTLEIASGEPVRRELVLTKAASVIDGTVEKAGAPQVADYVLLMPKNASERWAYRMDQTDSDGSFRLATIPAGDYFLIALSDTTELVYRDIKVAAKLAAAAKTVHIDAGDHLTMKLESLDTAALNLPSP